MANKIYVGNLSYSVTRDDLDNCFSEYGDISNISIPQDKETGRARGFAFIEFNDNQSAQGALEKDGTEFLGRRLKVNIAKERESRSGGGGRPRSHQRQNDDFFNG